MENLIKRLNFILYTLVAAFVIVVILRLVFEGSSIIQGDGVMLLLDILKWIILVAGVMIGVASDYIRYKEDPSKWLSKFKIMIITICGIVGLAIIFTIKYTADTSVNILHSALFWLCAACVVVGGIMWALTSKRE